MNKTQSLQTLLQARNTVVAPGVFDGLSARLAEQAGFEVIYASGGAIARSTGVPDIGLLSLTEVVERLTQIVDVTSVPVIADADTGFGNELNVRRTLEVFQRIGVAGLHIEDQESPKRCGHLQGKKLIPTDEMCKKIKVARKTLTDDNFLLIARTDAIAVEGFANAIDRARAYLDEGAHMIFVEAPETREQVEKIAKAIPEPKLINMFYGGKTPLIPKNELAAMGYQIIIIPSDLQRAAIRAMQNTLSVIFEKGDSQDYAENLASFEERETIIKTKEYLNYAADVS